MHFKEAVCLMPEIFPNYSPTCRGEEQSVVSVWLSPFGCCQLHFNGFISLHHSHKNLREQLAVHQHCKLHTPLTFTSLTEWMLTRKNEKRQWLSHHSPASWRPEGSRMQGRRNILTPAFVPAEGRARGWLMVCHGLTPQHYYSILCACVWSLMRGTL